MKERTGDGKGIARIEFKVGEKERERERKTEKERERERKRESERERNVLTYNTLAYRYLSSFPPSSHS